MNFHSYFPADGRSVSACIIGTGGFGRSFLSQGLRVPLMNVRIGVDVDAQTAAAAMRDVGIADADIRICTDAQSARAAHEAGHFIAAGDFAHVVDLPFDVAVEATGHPCTARATPNRRSRRASMWRWCPRRSTAWSVPALRRWRPKRA